MLFHVAFDLVLDQVGGDGVKHRAEHEVADARSSRRIHHGEAHGPFGTVQGRADMVEARDAAYGLCNEGGVSEIAQQHLLHALLPEVAGRLFSPHASAHAMSCRKKLRDQPLALVAVGGGDQDHWGPRPSLRLGDDGQLQIAGVTRTGVNAVDRTDVIALVIGSNRHPRRRIGLNIGAQATSCADECAARVEPDFNWHDLARF